MTDFAELLYRSLPAIYRLKDGDTRQLRSFLSIMADPLAELEASIGLLYEDLFASTARGELVPLIGALIGADIDSTLPTSLQRAALEDTFASYRSKGLAEPIQRTVQASTRWTTVAVDYSQVVARVPHVESLSPLLRRRGQVAGVDSSGESRFHFDPAGRVTALFDERSGRRMTRIDLATRAGDLVGTPGGFAIRDHGALLVGGSPATWTVVAADLTDFAAPLTPAGSSLALQRGQIAVDPELGRFVFFVPTGNVQPQPPPSGDVSVDFHQLDPASVAPQTVDLRDVTRVAQLGRSDDTAPYTIDIRSAERPTDRHGRAHFDNYGLFVTPAKRVENLRPNRTREGPPGGFTFDGRRILRGQPGHSLQLQDGIDGSPLTRQKLRGQESLFFDTPRGFVITGRGQSLRELASSTDVPIRTANLTDLANPLDVDGNPMTLGPRDVAVDPQLGRFLLTLSSFGLAADEVSVGYLLTPVVRVVAATPFVIAPLFFSFSADGAITPLRDLLDGTPLSTKLRLSATIADFHGGARGYSIRRNTSSLTSSLAADLRALDDPSIVVPAGKLYVDLDRGRFALPPGVLRPGDVLTVEYSASDLASEASVFSSLEQRLPRLVPAGVSPVIIDTRRPTVDPVHLTIARATKP